VNFSFFVWLFVCYLKKNSFSLQTKFAIFLNFFVRLIVCLLQLLSKLSTLLFNVKSQYEKTSAGEPNDISER